MRSGIPKLQVTFVSRGPCFSNDALGDPSQEKPYREASVCSTFGQMSPCDSVGLMPSQQVSDGGLSPAVGPVGGGGGLGCPAELFTALWFCRSVALDPRPRQSLPEERAHLVS